MADCKVGWVIQKPIPNFRTQSLRTAAGLPLWDPVAVKVSRISPEWRLHFSTKALKRLKVVFLMGSKPAQYRGCQILRCALNPAAYTC